MLTRHTPRPLPHDIWAWTGQEKGGVGGRGVEDGSGAHLDTAWKNKWWEGRKEGDKMRGTRKKGKREGERR
jgi:hypothetical protein